MVVVVVRAGQKTRGLISRSVRLVSGSAQLGSAHLYFVAELAF